MLATRSVRGRGSGNRRLRQRDSTSDEAKFPRGARSSRPSADPGGSSARPTSFVRRIQRDHLPVTRRVRRPGRRRRLPVRRVGLERSFGRPTAQAAQTARLSAARQPTRASGRRSSETKGCTMNFTHSAPLKTPAIHFRRAPAAAGSPSNDHLAMERLRIRRLWPRRALW